MPKCFYCGKVYEIPRGITFVVSDGNARHLCSSKCRKNMLMKRRKTRWISKRKETKAEIRKEIKAEVEAEHTDSKISSKN